MTRLTICKVRPDAERASNPSFVASRFELEAHRDVQSIREDDELCDRKVGSDSRRVRKVRPQLTRFWVGSHAHERFFCNADKVERIARVLSQTLPLPRADRVRDKIVEEGLGREGVGQRNGESAGGIGLEGAGKSADRKEESGMKQALTASQRSIARPFEPAYPLLAAIPIIHSCAIVPLRMRSASNLVRSNRGEQIKLTSARDHTFAQNERWMCQRAFPFLLLFPIRRSQQSILV
jgi:hypothetical protein